jgi:ABC-type glutathione transport system ATPase component
MPSHQFAQTPLVVDPMICSTSRTSFPDPRWRAVEAVRGVSFTLGRERLGIVGRVGLGQVADRPRHPGPDARQGLVTAKRLEFHGKDLLRLFKRASGASCAAGVSPWSCRTRSSRSTR